LDSYLSSTYYRLTYNATSDVGHTISLFLVYCLIEPITVTVLQCRLSKVLRRLLHALIAILNCVKLEFRLEFFFKNPQQLATYCMIITDILTAIVNNLIFEYKFHKLYASLIAIIAACFRTDCRCLLKGQQRFSSYVPALVQRRSHLLQVKHRKHLFFMFYREVITPCISVRILQTTLVFSRPY